MTRWIGAVWDALRAADRKKLSLVAAGVAFYMLLSLFPGAAVVVSVYGLVADPTWIGALLDDLAPYAPAEGLQFLREVVDRTLADDEMLGQTALISLLIAFWSAGSAVRALMTALQLAFPKTHAYGALVYIGLSLVFTLVGVALVALAISVLVLVPIAFEALRAIDADDRFHVGWDLLRSLEPAILLGLAFASLTLIYWVGSGRPRAPLSSAASAALVTTVVWLAVSRLLALYLAVFGDFDAVYGPFGAVAGLMLWFWISAFLLLVGVELTSAFARRAGGDARATP